MSETNIQACTICSNKQSTLLFEKHSDGMDFGLISIYRCKVCKAVYLGQYDEIYDNDLYEYYRQYQGKTKGDLYSQLNANRHLKLLDFFAQHTSSKSILDVGCGLGGFIDTALRDGWDINGIDLAQPAVEIAQSFGLPVQRLDFFSDTIRPHSYGIITMSEVLEHLHDPISFIKRAAEVVKPGGLIYLTTPNFDCFDRLILGKAWPVFHPEHITYFTPKVLLSAIREKTELEILYSETRNISIQSLQRIKSIFHGRNIQSKNPPQSAVKINSADDLREAVEGSLALQFVKRVINGILNTTSSGNTIFMLLKRPI